MHYVDYGYITKRVPKFHVCVEGGVRMHERGSDKRNKSTEHRADSYQLHIACPKDLIS